MGCRGGAVKRAFPKATVRLRMTIVAAAVIVAAGAVMALVTGSSHKNTLTVVSERSAATVTVAPPGQLHNDQTVQIQLRGFPAGRQVSLAECPTVGIRPDISCSQAPAQKVLTTDRYGSATTSFLVQLAPAAFNEKFGPAKCAAACLLIAATTTAPTVSATASLSFAEPSPQPSPPTRLAEPPGFGVAAASFISANQGWALGSTGCLGCAGIAATHDGGHTWTPLPAPPASLYWYYPRSSAVSNIDFANTSDGYLFTPGLYATHDGGRTWSNQRLSDVKSLTVAGDYAYALTGYHGAGPEALYRSQLGTSSWLKVALPAPPRQGQTFTTAAAGSAVVLMRNGLSSVGITAKQVGSLWVSTDAGGSWQARTMPCTVADGGATVLSVARGHPQAWLVICFNNRQSSQEQDTEQHLYGTATGGSTWVRLANPPQHNAPVELADNGSGHAFLATEGARDTLNGTLDGGTSWTTAIRDGGSFSGWSDLQFASTTTGYVVGPSRDSSSAGTRLYQTTDGGQSWHVLNVAP